MISANIGGIKENNRWDLLINYCKTLNRDFPISQETHINFSRLRNISKLWDEEVIISPGKTQTCGVLVLAKGTPHPIEQIITDPAGRYVFFKMKNRADGVIAFRVPSGTMKGWRTDRQMLTKKLRNYRIKKIIRKNNLIVFGDFNMTLGNKGRVQVINASFCLSQKELVISLRSLI